MTQKEYTVTIHGNRMWRRMQEEAARRKRRGRIIQGVHCLLTAALAIALLCVCLGAKEPGQLPEPVAEQQNTVVTLNTISPSPLPDTTTGQLASDLAEEAEYIAKALYGEARGVLHHGAGGGGLVHPEPGGRRERAVAGRHHRRGDTGAPVHRILTGAPRAAGAV